MREIWLDIKALFCFLSIVVPLMFAVSVLVSAFVNVILK